MDWKEDAQRLWPLFEQYIPARREPDGKKGGRPRISDELVFHQIVRFLRAGCAWDVFDELTAGSDVSGRTCRRRLAEWREADAFELVCDEMRHALPDAKIAHLDATFIRSRGGGDDLVGLTRHGKGSKIQVMCDSDSQPIMFQLTSANPAESTITSSLIEDHEHLPKIVVADKAYDSDSLRDEFTAKNSMLLVPHRAKRSKPPRDQHQVGRHYKQRWRIERYFSWLAAYRRLATRWERSSQNYWHWLCLGVSLLYTRHRYWP